jgi:hypothetical protein
MANGHCAVSVIALAVSGPFPSAKAEEQYL